MAERVDELLERTRAEGTFDSQGRFEIQGKLAAEKLARFSVAKPEQWILKMVQAAVAGGADSLRVFQARKECILRFAFAQPPAPQDVQTAIFSPEVQSAPLLHELAIGLRSLLQDRHFRLRWPSSSGFAELAWDGQKMEARPCQGGVEAFEVVVTYPPNWLTGSYLERAAESRILQTDAAYCPIPLFLDNREVSVHDTPPTSSYADHSRQSPCHFACGYLGDPQSEPTMALATRLKNPLREETPLVRWRRAEGRTHGSFSLFASHRIGKGYSNEPFSLIWTRNGVACASRKIPDLPLGGFLALSGDHLRADLGGLSLQVQEEDVQQGLAQLPTLTPLGEFAIDWVGGFQSKTTVTDVLGYTAIALGGLFLIGLCFVGAGEALGGLGALNLGGSGSDKGMVELQSELRRRFGQLVTRGQAASVPSNS